MKHNEVDRASNTTMTIDNVSEKKRQERMKFIKGKKKFMFYPDERITNVWEFVMMISLIFVSIVSPIRIAFAEEEPLGW